MLRDVSSWRLADLGQWPGIGAKRTFGMARTDAHDPKLINQSLGIPGLDRSLAHDLAALDIEHGGAEHLRAIRIGAGLREGERAAVGDGGLDAMRHRAAADVVVIGRDRPPALELARPARRI